VVVFSGLNSSLVEVNFYVAKFHLALSFLLLLAMLVGVVMMGLVCLSSWLRHKSKIRQFRSDINQLNKELDNLRKLPMKDLEL
jgi:lipopolysaccharide assembly protein A